MKGGPPSCYGNGDLHPATLIMAVQTSLIRDNLEQTLDNSRRMVDLTRQLADEARRIAAVQVEESLQRVSRTA